MKVLLTGAAGFIGSNLLTRLLDDERVEQIYAVDNFSNGRVEFLPEAVKQSARTIKAAGFPINFSRGKLHFVEAKFQSCSSAFSKAITLGGDFNVYQCVDAVIHLAAMPRVGLSIENPQLSLETNLTGTIEMLNDIRWHNPKLKFIFASSSAVYGHEDPGIHGHSATFSETHPISPYALHKLQVEQHLRMYKCLYGMKSVALRLFNVIGPNQIGGAPYSTALSNWLRAAHAGESLKLYGDGSHSRDLVHVDDVCRAFETALFEEVDCTVANVGSGAAYTNLEVLDLVRRLHPQVVVEHLPQREGDAKKTLCRMNDFVNKFGDWEPMRSLQHSVIEIDRWYKKNWNWISKLNMKW